MGRKPFCPPTQDEAWEVTGSHSQDDVFDTCSRLYAYQYLLKLKEESGAPLVYGNAGHDALEQLQKGASVQQAAETGLQAFVRDGGRQLLPAGEAWLPQHVQGYATHIAPSFLSEWRVVATEQEYQYDVAPGIKQRGYIDVVAQRISDGHIGIFDYKFSSKAYMDKLCENLNWSAQFSYYCMAWVRQVCPRVFPDMAPFWPSYVGYQFLLKPKKGDNLESAKMYKSKGIVVSPRFQGFCLDVEQNQVRKGLMKREMRRQYAREGQAAFDRFPANYQACFRYGQVCRFSDGCHQGTPLHRSLRFEDRRP